MPAGVPVWGSGAGLGSLTVRRDAGRSHAICLGWFRPVGTANTVLVMGQRTDVMFVTSAQMGTADMVPDAPESGSTTATSATTCWGDLRPFAGDGALGVQGFAKRL